jgi:hypothetical protein
MDAHEKELMDLYGPFIERKLVDKETANYLWNEGFCTLELLQKLPVENMLEALSECPEIRKLGRQAGIEILKEEAIKGWYCLKPLLNSFS